MATNIEKITSDWKTFKALRLSAFRNEPTAFSTSIEQAESYEDKYWIDMVSDPNNIILVAKVDWVNAGLVRAALKDEDVDEHTAFIGSMYVEKEYRRQGIAAALLGGLLVELKKHPDILRAKLWVNTQQTAAIKLYEGFGFVQVGVETGEVQANGLPVQELIMEATLQHTG